jgi:Zn-dependent protease/tetratricopeptide (TPR) repeat protein
MTCAACQRANLPGGVRCIYCGSHFPSSPDFELPEAPLSPPPAPAAEDRSPRAARRGLAGVVLAAVLLLAKGKSLIGLLKVGPLLTTLGSMFVFIWAQAQFFGWRFAVGFAVCILIHELGHVYAGWRHGVKASAPMFIPFVGAVILVKRFPDNPEVEAEIGAGGPAAGLLAAAGCALVALLTGSSYWLALANIGFFINLFNLLPISPLDGSRIASAFSPGNWNFVLLALLLWAIKVPSPLLWGLLIVAFFVRIGTRSDGRHHLAPPAAGVRMALVYLGLCISLTLGFDQGQQAATQRGLRAGFAGAAAPSPRESPDSRQLARGEDHLSARDRPPRRAAAPGEPRQEDVNLLVWMLEGLGLIAVALGWLIGWPLAAYLLVRAAGERMGGRGWALAGWMMASLPALVGAALLLRVPGSELRSLLLAYGAALAAALPFAIFRASRVVVERPSRTALTRRCLAWAAAAALVVGYWQESLWVVLAVALGASAYYAPRRWLLASLGARLAERNGDLERAVALRRAALALDPGPDDAAALWRSIARDYSALGRGGDALAAQGAAPPPGPTSPATSLMDGTTRMAAHIERDDYEAALMECERLLRPPSGGEPDPLGGWRLLLVHCMLGQLALYRGWPDEALAQANVVIGAVPAAADGPVRRLGGAARRLHATAQVRLGRLDAARHECDRLPRWGRDPTNEAALALIRAEAELAAGDAATAGRETALARQRLPGSLSVRYWRGRSLVATNRRAEGEALLQGLVAEYPEEHWGRRARQDLESAAD